METLVPADHCYRQLERALDRSFVRAWIADNYAARGRPGIDPQVFFKLQLIMFFAGLRSERRLMETVRLQTSPAVRSSYAISLIVINTKRQVGGKGRNSGRSRLGEERKRRDLRVLSLLVARDQRDCVRAPMCWRGLYRTWSLIHREGRRRQGLASAGDVRARALGLLRQDAWLRTQRRELIGLLR